MNNLYSIIQDCWLSIIKDYKDGIICSERQMQALLFFHLKQNIAFKEYGVFLETTIPLEDGIVIPDVLITKCKEIVAIMELKYNPHKYVEYKKDLSTFESIIGMPERYKKINLITNPNTGNWAEREEYSIGNEILCIYMVIGKKGSDVFNCSISNSNNQIRYAFFSVQVEPNSLLFTTQNNFQVFSK